MAKNTKERILDAALEIFARDGYAGANIKDIAESVGLVKSAFYRHFESKEEIWNTVLQRMEEYYSSHFDSSGNLPDIPESMGEFREAVMNMFDFTVHNERIALCRKILLTEQFRSEKIKALATEHFNVHIEKVFENMFSGMIEKGFIKADNPQMLAFSFTSPITSLVHLCDRDPEKTPEVRKKVLEYIDFFVETYGG